MKKLFSLALALALCLSLSPPAMAAFHDLYIEGPNGEPLEEADGVLESGQDADHHEIVTLNGVKNVGITAGSSPIITLAPGSKNELLFLGGGDSERTNDITIKGTGELIIYSPNPTEFIQNNGVFSGLITSFKLEDGLVMTGGTKLGDNNPLELKVIRTDPVNGSKTSAIVVGNTPAMYIRIAPAEPSAAGFTDVANSSPYAEAIKWAVEKGITNGTSATAFSPNTTCTIRQILTFLYRANGRPGAVSGQSDLDAAITWAINEGLLAATVETDAECSRSGAMQFMWKAAGSPTPTKTASFSDVTAGSLFEQAIYWAVEKGITNGTSSDQFSPFDFCTRGQIVTFLYRAYK